jgi:hypothetical protein
VKVLSYFPVTITVDGEPIVIRIKRMNHAEWFAFELARRRAGTPTIARFVSRRPDEMARNPETQAFLESFESVCARRREGWTAEEHAAFDAAVEADEREAEGFLLETFDRYVTVERGLTEETDAGEVQVKTGLDLLRIFGARGDVLEEVLAAVWSENSLDAKKKAILQSQRASGSISTAPPPDPAGPRPATTVSPVETEASAGIAGATRRRRRRSGSTATSRSGPAQSRA